MTNKKQCSDCKHWRSFAEICEDPEEDDECGICDERNEPDSEGGGALHTRFDDEACPTFKGKAPESAPERLPAQKPVCEECGGKGLTKQRIRLGCDMAQGLTSTKYTYQILELRCPRCNGTGFEPIRQVWKFEVDVGENIVAMPAGSRVLKFGAQEVDPATGLHHQQPKLFIWAEVSPHETPKYREFVIIGTGHEFKRHGLTFIETCIIGGFVWHCYERGV